MADPLGYIDRLADPTGSPSPLTDYHDGRTDSLTPKLELNPGSAARYKAAQDAGLFQGPADGPHQWAASLLQTELGLGVFDLWVKATLLRAFYFGDEGLVQDACDAVYADGHSTIAPPDPLVPNVWAVWWFGVGVLIGVDGTSNVQQWIDYLYSSDQVPFVTSDGNRYGNVFQAFYTAAQNCRTAAETFIAAHVGYGNVYQLCGHSLGGAVAHMLGRLLPPVVGYRPCLCTTFGAPRPGDNGYRFGAGWPTCVRVVEEDDPVTLVPPTVFVRSGPGNIPVPARYAHPGGRRVGLTVDGDISYSNGVSSDDRGAADALAPIAGLQGQLMHHLLKNYNALLQSLAFRGYRDEAYTALYQRLWTVNQFLSAAGG